MSEDIPLTPLGTSLAGKTAIVTGGNKGLGFEVARQFLLLKISRLIITVRDESKGTAAVEALKADPEVISASAEDKSKPRIEFFLLSLDDYQSGVLFTRKVNAEVRGLHILVLNAGINLFEYQTSKSGHEKVMQGLTTRQSRGYPGNLTLKTNQSTATPTSSLSSP
jgi:NAD(P)-dependent dehydrogenase (short-subunit alcohol dehydrogenase family)